MSGIFEVEIASGERTSLQAAVDRLFRILPRDEGSCDPAPLN
ncbi:hypothetical protein [Thiohalocapsa marina]|nr:hypothetical protein [Thiohalocapsa marina]